MAQGIHPATRHGGDSKSDQVAVHAIRSFADETATAKRRSARVVRQDAERREKVIPEAMDLMSGTPLDTSAYLDRIKGMPPNDQITTVKRDLAIDKLQAKAEFAVGARLVIAITPWSLPESRLRLVPAYRSRRRGRSCSPIRSGP